MEFWGCELSAKQSFEWCNPERVLMLSNACISNVESLTSNNKQSPFVTIYLERDGTKLALAALSARNPQTTLCVELATVSSPLRLTLGGTGADKATVSLTGMEYA